MAAQDTFANGSDGPAEQAGAEAGATVDRLGEDLRNGAAEADSRVKDFADKAERAVRERADEFRRRARDYYQDATDRVDTAQRYLSERVQEKPVASTLTAIGVGVVLGLLLSGGRRR